MVSSGDGQVHMRPQLPPPGAEAVFFGRRRSTPMAETTAQAEKRPMMTVWILRRHGEAISRLLPFPDMY
jgi:hypothetical protein